MLSNSFGKTEVFNFWCFVNNKILSENISVGQTEGFHFVNNKVLSKQICTLQNSLWSF